MPVRRDAALPGSGSSKKWPSAPAPPGVLAGACVAYIPDENKRPRAALQFSCVLYQFMVARFLDSLFVL
jgi:hypothetical protein